MNYNIGDIIKVTVTSIENYGIFVMVDDNFNGMIHISEMSDSFVSNVRNYAFLGEEIHARIIDIDYEKQQIKLSIKSLNYRADNPKNKFLESPNGFNKLKRQLPYWIDDKLREINANE